MTKLGSGLPRVCNLISTFVCPSGQNVEPKNMQQTALSALPCSKDHSQRWDPPPAPPRRDRLDDVGCLDADGGVMGDLRPRVGDES